MKKVYVFLADGFEDVEALIPVDVWRRGGIDVTTVSISDFPLVNSAHGVNIEADIMFEQGEFDDADLIFLPGGMPGATNLFEHKGVCKTVVDQHMAGKKVAAICASPADSLDGRSLDWPCPHLRRSLLRTQRNYQGIFTSTEIVSKNNKKRKGI